MILVYAVATLITYAEMYPRWSSASRCPGRWTKGRVRKLDILSDSCAVRRNATSKEHEGAVPFQRKERHGLMELFMHAELLTLTVFPILAGGAVGLENSNSGLQV